MNEMEIVQQRFENHDCTNLYLNEDLLGGVRGEMPIAGPLENLAPGNNRIKIWSRKF